MQLCGVPPGGVALCGAAVWVAAVRGAAVRGTAVRCRRVGRGCSGAVVRAAAVWGAALRAAMSLPPMCAKRLPNFRKTCYNHAIMNGAIINAYRKKNIGGSMNTLAQKVEALPLLPGCYIFKNKLGHIIYVGKSKCLRRRVLQYFTGLESKWIKLVNLAHEIADVDHVVTDDETDALLLECRLIKTHKPHYNAQLKRDAPYPYLSIDLRHAFPGVCVTEQLDPDAENFGCFRRPEHARQAIELLGAVWHTPMCGRAEFDADKPQRPCLSYELGRCMAPCAARVTREQYARVLGEMIAFLRGEDDRMLSVLEARMREAAAGLRFEQAEVCRRQLQSLERLANHTRKFDKRLDGKTLCLFVRAYREQGCTAFYVRDGEARLRMRLPGGEARPDALTRFARAICGGAPEEFVREVPEGAFMAKCLTDIYADKLYVRWPGEADVGEVARILIEGHRELMEIG